MQPRKFFFVNLLLNAVRYGIVFLISLVVTIVGMFGVPPCLYIGWGLLVLYVILCVIGTLRMQKLISYRSEDNPEFNDLMDLLSNDPDAVLSEIMEQQAQNRSLHGEELLTLSDDDLFETVFFQVTDLADDPETDEFAPNNLTEGQKTVYVLATFDSEVQNGGLCQFFVNSSRAVAPLVGEYLTAVGADEHRRLYEDFIRNNGLDLTDLSSFMVTSRRGFIKQTKRYDFDAFDDAYCELPALQELVVAYIRTHYTQF